MKSESKKYKDVSSGIRSKIKWTLQPRDQEHPTGISQTVPDETLTIRDILNKYTTGMLPPIQMNGTFSNQEGLTEDEILDLEDLETLSREDLAIRQERLRDSLEEVTRLTNEKRKKERDDYRESLRKKQEQEIALKIGLEALKTQKIEASKSEKS